MRKINACIRLAVLIISLSVKVLQVAAQCGSTISAFPYAENFEASRGGWVSGGTSNDWAWGAPAKSAIVSAGSGNKCWVTGGLTGSFYNYGERSYVKSPCFDFSGLPHPMIDFLLFWDSEHTYDGLVLQSSIDGGTTWVNVGAYGDSVNCENQNWYNTKTVTNLNTLATVKNGWTGNNLATQGSCQGGSGSLRWVNAKHCLTGLGGQPSVIFRFAFGAGTTCNDFDGLGFDSIGIGESPVITDSFTTSCLGQRKVAFTGITSECPNVFSWNFGDPNSGAANTASTTNATHTFSAPGSYTVSYTVSGPCNAPATFSSVVNVLGVTDSVHNISCAGLSNGSINLSVSGGIAPYSFNWSDGNISPTRTGLSVGTYIVTVSGAQGCGLVDTFTISQPQTLVVTDSVSNSACGGLGNTGAITLTITGGTAPYSFNWGGGIITQNRTGLAIGQYSVTVTDVSGCSVIKQATITEPVVLTVLASPVNAACFGAATGAITLSVTGGTSPYTFNWGGGVTLQNRTALAAGSYTVTVTDRAGCNATASAVVGQPASAISVTLAPTNATCTVGGTILSTPSGGAGIYTFNWGGGITTQNRSGLGAGTYTVTVTDTSGCTATASATLTSASTIQINPTSTPVSCNGGNNGSINLNPTGGTSGFTYNWGGGIITQNRNGLTAGIYGVTVTDNSSCTASASITVTQPAVLAANAAATAISCFGGINGSIALTDTGGNLPYSYNWGGGIITQNRTGLTVGSYTVTVTDLKGCSVTASATITQPAPLTINDSTATPLCFGSSNGIIVVKAAGGTGPYLYTWASGSQSADSVRAGLSAGNYTVTVIDSKGCTDSASVTLIQPSAIQVVATATTTSCDAPTGTVDITVTGGAGESDNFIWSNGATTQNISSVGSDVYSVTVTDFNGCSGSASAVVSQTVGPQITFTTTPLSCNNGNDGSINANVTGGTPGYTYTWSTGDISVGISGLSTGNYKITVLDAHSCSATASDSLSNPAPILLHVSLTNAKCYGDSNGSISISVSGGTPVYHYSWSNGDSSAIINNLAVDSYSVTLTDANRCSVTSSIFISQPTKLQISALTDSTTCSEPNGRAYVVVTGGIGAYSFVWLPSVSDSSTAVGLNVGHYQVTATDSAGCSITDTFSLGGRNTEVVKPYLGVDTFICPGSNETVLLIPGIYAAYFWQDSSTKQQYLVKDTGTYWVVVTDSNGCKSSDTILVAEKCNTRFVVPTAFTPNGDGKNDVFIPLYIDAPATYKLHIYNRWGQLVFESNNVTSGWDGTFKGKAQPSGTFIYYIQYAYTGQKEQGLQGLFELLR